MLNISVVIINYNSSKYTIKCVESILQKTDHSLNYKIYVVDNNSEINDFISLNKYFNDNPNPKTVLCRSTINKGFGGGNMFGYELAEPSEYVAFVNNDTLFLNDCLSELYQFIKKNHSVGIVGGQSFNENGKEIISFDHYASTTRQIFGRKFLELINPKDKPTRKKSYAEPLKVNTVSGSFMLINSNDFNTIGGFDEHLFLYYEETDVCLRLKKVNKDCFLVPNAHYLHYHGASTQASIAIKKELKISLIYLVQKHYGWLSKKVLLSYLVTSSFFASILKPSKWSFFTLYLQGAPLSKSLKNKQKITKI
ncbi:glycosyltransferase family 2 protein [Flavobacterium sp. xlx-214]|uniref:glycosyltransferase family 2 protein n=1 Tax=unclassified Flavobacterium TaxID=196869 RepID=UPI0013D89A25|nr:MULTISPECIES: glycosyltransferase family 2 protein [unclassified Flavobacterium]MBA5791195.1 glycosyltransferase family 2 protein [Flavobacterium sp. xlx-221]QMI83635.1 glycosyltransferase family 2 protein [Flavobacterium sp. xlx-214]